MIAARRRRPPDQNARWFYNPGVVLENQGAKRQAIEKYRQVLERSPNYTVAMRNLSLLLAGTGQAAEAARLNERLSNLFRITSKFSRILHGYWPLVRMTGCRMGRGQ